MQNTLDSEITSPPAIEVYPSLVTRYQSAFIDLLVIIVMMFAAGYLLEYMENPPDWIRIALFFGIWAVYEPLLTSLGCTIGQYCMKIRVVNFNNREKKIIFPAALLRYVFKLLLGWLSFLTIGANKDSRAIHDIMAGSVVIYKK